MKKLRLPVEDLKVDTFEVVDTARDLKGTVEAYISINGSCPRPCTYEVSYCVCDDTVDWSYCVCQ